MASRFFPFVIATQDQQDTNFKTIRPGRQAIRKAPAPVPDDKPIDQQLADAFNANNAVLAYVLATTGSTLPVVSPLPNPDWYTPFVRAFSDAKVHALAWQNTVTPGLVSIPQGIVNYAGLFNLFMSNIDQALDILKKDPRNQSAQNVVLASLRSLHQGVSRYATSATKFQSDIKKFADDLTRDSRLMGDAIKKALDTEKVDLDQVRKLEEKVQQLNDTIATLQVVVTAAAIGAGVSFFAGAVIAIFSFGAGLAFGIIGAAAGITTVVVAQAEIQRLSREIAHDQAQMKGLEQQVASLRLLQSNLQTLITLSGAASQQVDLIVRAWQELERELGAVIKDLDDAEGDLGKMDLAALQADLNEANADWQTLQSFAKTIASIQYNQAAPNTVTLPTTPSAQSLLAA